MDLATSTMEKEDHNKPSHMKLYISAVSACMGAVCLGTAIGYSSSAVPKLISKSMDDTDISLTEIQGSWFASIITVPALVGGLSGGLLARSLGRRRTMLLAALWFFGAWSLTIFAQNFAMLMASRAFIGLSTGVCCAIIPTYVGEITSVEVRGALGSLFQLMIVIGLEYSYVFGAIVDSWRTLAAICLAPPVVFFVMVFLSKESPVYLLSVGNEKGASESLQYLRGKEYDIQKELELMKNDLAETKKDNISVKRFCNSYLMKPLLISLTLMFFQQVSGITAILFNLNSIFQAAKTEMSEGLCVIIVGFIQIPATCVSTILLDRAGRKALLVVSSTVMAISLGSLGLFFYLQDQGNSDSLEWLPLTSLVVFIIAFYLGFGPIPWLMMNELFPRAYAEVAGSLVTTLNWTIAFFTTLFFVPLKDAINVSGIFVLYAGFCILGLVFSILAVPETKGKTLQEITAYFKGTSTAKGDNTNSSAEQEHREKKTLLLNHL